jgi:excisionase family DNA binding protein
MSMQDFEPLLSADDAAKLLGGIHPKTLMRRARAGEVPGYQIARSWYFRASELDTWLRSLVPLRQANNARVN